MNALWEDVDGIDRPFERAFERAMAEDRAAKVASAPPRCSCGAVDANELVAAGQPAECSGCQTFRCSRCERWVSWDRGCADDMPGLCDDCWVVIDGAT